MYMIIYLYFNLLFLSDKQFIQRMNELNDEFGKQPLEMGLEQNRFHFFRMELKSQADINQIIERTKTEIYKYFIFH